MRLAVLPKSGDSTWPSPSEMLLLHRTKEMQWLRLKEFLYLPYQSNISGSPYLTSNHFCPKPTASLCSELLSSM